MKFINSEQMRRYPRRVLNYVQHTKQSLIITRINEPSVKIVPLTDEEIKLYKGKCINNFSEIENNC